MEEEKLIPVSKIYRELGINGDSLKVWATHLNISYIKINRKNYCTQEDYLKIKSFYNQPNLKEIQSKLEIEKRKQTCQKVYGGDSPMSSKHIKNKIKNTCLKKYGVEHPLKSEEVKIKSKESLIKRYGTSIISHIPEVNEKRRKTCLEKYGVEYSCQSQQMMRNSKETKLKRYGNVNYNNREKAEKTCLEKYGVKNVKQVDDVKEKGVQTCLEKYGTKYYTQTQEMKNKSEETCLRRYGVRKASQSKKVQEKVKQTVFKHYGVEHPLQSNELLRKSHKKWRVSGLENISFASKEEAYYYIYLKDNNQKFEYQVEYPIPYLDNENKEHIFIVDFKVYDKYVEIKGDQFFDSEGNAQFPYNQNDTLDNSKRLSQWKSKLNVIKNNDNIELILSSSFNKGGINYHMKEYFDKNYYFIKNF